MDSLTDEQIMVEVKKGNKELFNMILDRYYKSILNYSYRLIGNKESAEDAAQDIFSKIYFAANKYQPTAPFRIFLYTIALRESLKLIKKRKNYLSYENFCNIPSKDNPSTDLEKKHISLMLRQAILKLSPKYRAAIILREYNNLSYEEISQVLKCSLANTKNYLFRAKSKLKELLMPALRGAL